jgi:hypothetical protein
MLSTMNGDGEALLKDYEIKVRYYSDTMQRVWMRFNFFLTVQAGLVAGLAFLSDEGTLKDSAIYVLIAEAFLSLVWYAFGAQDRWIVAAFREQVNQSWQLAIKQPSASALRDTPHAGQTEALGRKQWKGLLEWRWQLLSTTRLPAAVPFLLFVIWVVLIGVFVGTR